jgi:ribosomal 50S subunit-associated protein YjgA (DUF615 family)
MKQLFGRVACALLLVCVAAGSVSARHTARNLTDVSRSDDRGLQALTISVDLGDLTFDGLTPEAVAIVAREAPFSLDPGSSIVMLLDSVSQIWEVTVQVDEAVRQIFFRLAYLVDGLWIVEELPVGAEHVGYLHGGSVRWSLRYDDVQEIVPDPSSDGFVDDYARLGSENRREGVLYSAGRLLRQNDLSASDDLIAGGRSALNSADLVELAIEKMRTLLRSDGADAMQNYYLTASYGLPTPERHALLFEYADLIGPLDRNGARDALKTILGDRPDPSMAEAATIALAVNYLLDHNPDSIRVGIDQWASDVFSPAAPNMGDAHADGDGDEQRRHKLRALSLGYRGLGENDVADDLAERAEELLTPKRQANARLRRFSWMAAQGRGRVVVRAIDGLLESGMAESWDVPRLLTAKSDAFEELRLRVERIRVLEELSTQYPDHDEGKAAAALLESLRSGVSDDDGDVDSGRGR